MRRNILATYSTTQRIKDIYNEENIHIVHYISGYKIIYSFVFLTKGTLLGDCLVSIVSTSTSYIYINSLMWSLFAAMTQAIDTFLFLQLGCLLRPKFNV